MKHPRSKALQGRIDVALSVLNDFADKETADDDIAAACPSCGWDGYLPKDDWTMKCPKCGVSCDKV